MNAATLPMDAAPSALKSAVGAFGHEPPPTHATDLATAQAKAHKASQARAAVPLGMLMRPFANVVAGFTSVLSMIWRAIVNALRRIAGLNNVALESMPERSPQHLDQAAAFAGDADNAAEAAGQAADAIRREGDLAMRLSKETPDFAQALQDDGARAYLHLALQRLGSELEASQQLQASQQQALQTQAAPVAERLGVSIGDLVALLMRANLDERTLSTEPSLPALREQALQLRDTTAQVDQLRQRFADYCVAADDCPDAERREEFALTVQAALQRANDPILGEVVRTARSQARQQGAPAPVTGLSVADTVSAPDIPGTATEAKQPVRRRRFAGVDVGQTDAGDQAEVSATSASAGLPPVPLVHSRPLDLGIEDLHLHVEDRPAEPQRQRAKC